MGPNDIIIVCSRHVEAIILMTKCEQDKKYGDSTTICCGFKAKIEQKSEKKV